MKQKTFHLDDGSQTWFIEAKDRESAIKKFIDFGLEEFGVLILKTGLKCREIRFGKSGIVKCRLP